MQLASLPAALLLLFALFSFSWLLLLMYIAATYSPFQHFFVLCKVFLFYPEYRASCTSLGGVFLNLVLRMAFQLTRPLPRILLIRTN
ncbi:hypothetical protein BT96DRAFT_913252, partial [Gymnopus androsaceus JB14]